MVISFHEAPEARNSGRFSFTQEPRCTRFGFFTDEEVIRMSVKKVESPNSYDTLGHPIPGGLYDAAMGPTDRSHGACVTCGLDNVQCPGHLGHIELHLPVYNPLVFGNMYKILQMKCFKCHNFRAEKKTARILRVKLLLLEANLYEEACQLAEFCNHKPAKSLDDEEDSKVDTIEKELRRYEAMALAVFVKSGNDMESRRFLSGRTNRTPSPIMHVHCRTLWRESVNEFLGKQPTTCANCGAKKLKIRKAGYTKIFRGAGVADNVVDAMDQDDNYEVDSEFGDLMNESQEASKGEIYMHAAEVEAHLAALWKAESGLVSRLWGTTSEGEDNPTGYKCFFLRILAVAPPRFRPPARMEGMTLDHPQSMALRTVLQTNSNLTSYQDVSFFRSTSESNDTDASTKTSTENMKEGIRELMDAWVALQDAVNVYLDSQKAKTPGSNPGVRQALEKKEGLFRQNMMGKRVNYAARSVISPDPYIGTDEVGLPVRFATKLYYPEPVTGYNVNKLAKMVENGADQWPGAAFVENEDGSMIDLSNRSLRQRQDIASSLGDLHRVSLTQSQPGFGRFVPGEESGLFKSQRNKAHAPLSLRKQKKVWRHVISGDVMLANRQPTLHKPSLMAHKVRVINNPAMQTIRLHYSNCDSYNADFDGDEINLHLPQSEICRAEAYEVAFTNHQYCSATDGEPLRGLIQDHVDMGVLLTQLGTFLTKEEYSQMVFAACGAMQSKQSHIRLAGPAILKPKPMWTGKQVINTILMHLIGSDVPETLISLGPRKTKIPPQAWKDYRKNAKVPSKAFLKIAGDEAGPLGETQIVVRQGVLCTGVLDKSQFGASKHGLVHSIHELYGPNAAGELLSSFGRLFTFCAQKWGHTCAIEDLVLTADAEEERTKNIHDSIFEGLKVSAAFVDVKDPKKVSNEQLAKLLYDKIRVHNNGEDVEAHLDSAMQAATSKVQSKIIGDCLPQGQRKPFPDNCFSLMIYSGAKGSLVNHSQVSCALGQQALEGRRVPRTIAGKSLPCFSSFDPTPRAGGYVSDRFLTGVRPQEYYFHCMAGREGLIDTAVKTARSGYLQRCLVKHLENLTVHYDRSVRISDGSCVQFLYGDDGLDAVNTSYLQGCSESLGFLYSNVGSLLNRLQIGSASEGKLDISGTASIDVRKAVKLHKDIQKTKSRSAKLENDIAIFAGAQGIARRPARISSSHTAASPLAEKDLLPGFHSVRVTKTHKGDHSVDLVYQSDGQVLKRFPVFEDNGKRRLVYGTMPDPVMSQLEPDTHLGAICERLQERLDTYIGNNPHGILKTEDDNLSLQQLLWVKYMKSMVAPGENVGVIAAQSIGEPSTQMTLNTFHLAGHGAGNVTLGIPRMRELLMTASQNQKTPSMSLPLLPHVKREEAESIKASMYRLRFSELLHAESGGVNVVERMVRRSFQNGTAMKGSDAVQACKEAPGTGQWFREYEVRMNLQHLDAIQAEFGLTLTDIGHRCATEFAPRLLKMIKKELSRAGKILKRVTANDQTPEETNEDDLDESKDDTMATPSKKKKSASAKIPNGDDDDDDGEEEGDEASIADEEDGNMRLHVRKEIDGYDDDDNSDESDVDSVEAPVDVEDSLEPSSARKKDNKDKKAKRQSGTSGWQPVTQVPDLVSGYPCWQGMYTKQPTSKDPASVIIVLQFPASSKKLLMVGLAEQAASESIIKCVPGITNSYVVENKDGSLSIATAGSNFAAAFELADKVDVNKIQSNNVGAILHTYGVEAARAALVGEVGGVFGAYGIGVDNRHVGLVADYMTFEGGYRPLNRGGMASCPSPFVRMTFETSTAFLTASALQGERDYLKSVSARLCMGELLQSGTGCFDLLVPQSTKAETPKDVSMMTSYSLKSKSASVEAVKKKKQSMK